MAISTEIFRAELKVETQLQGAISELGNLKTVTEEATSALRELSSVTLKIDDSAIKGIADTVQKLREEITAEFGKLREDLVGHSIIRDTVAEINALFATIPNKADPEIAKLKAQFQDMRKAALDMSKAIGEGAESNKTALQGMIREFATKMGGVDPNLLAQAFKNTENSAEPAKQTIKEINVTLDEFKKKVEAAGQAQREELDARKMAQDAAKFMDQRAAAAAKEVEQIRKIGEETSAAYDKQGQAFREQIAQTSSELGALNERWQAVGAIGQESIDRLNNPIKNFREGIRLATAEGGNLALGLRQAFFGISDSTSVIAKGLEFVGGRFNELSRAENAFAKETLRINESMRGFTTTMRDQIDIIKDVAKTEGVAKEAFNELDSQVKRVENAFKDMDTTIKATGKPTEQQMARVQEEVRVLEQTLRQLVAQGIIPAGSETEKMINEMIKGVRQQGLSTDQMIARVKVLRSEIASAEQKQKEANDTGEQQVGIIKRITVSFSNLFNITRNTTEEINNTTNEMRELGSATTRTGQVLNTAKGAFLGFVGAAAVLTGLRYAFDGIGFAVRRLAGDILEVNTTMQDFGITVTKQLQGSSLQAMGLVDDVKEAVSDFILDVGAKTPFETIELFESVPLLVASGLDPQQWLKPMADLAAAMNKPFDQVRFALQKLVSGETGDAIRQFRDMGLVMQDVAIYTDVASGKLLSIDDALKAQKMSAEELTQAGWARMGLEFKKSGELATGAGDALNVINGYLQQNAKFSGAAEARSKGFMGVMSNLKDNVNALYLAMGQPVLQNMTSAVTGLLVKMNEMMPLLEGVANRVGVWLSGAFSSAIDFISNFDERFSGLIETVKSVIAIVASVFSGEWGDAWGIFLSAINDGLAASEQIFDNFANAAFTWGWNFIVQVANGIIDSVGSVLISALNYVGDTIANFLAPGSPPKEGPLSDIDKWGGELLDIFGASVEEIDTESLERALEDMSGLMKDAGQELPKNFVEGFSQIDFEGAIRSARSQFGEFMGTFGEFNMKQVLGGLKPGDFDFIRSALSPIKDFLKESVGKEGFEPFMRVRETLAQIVSELNQTGEVNEKLFGQIDTVLGKHNKELTAYLKAQLQLQAAQKKVSEAEKRGFVTKELKAELAAAEDKVEKEKELLDWQKETRDLQNEFLGGLDKAAKAMGKAANAAARAAKERQKEQLTTQEWYDQERALLEEKYKLGIIDEQEYLQSLLNLEKQFVDRSMKEGVVAGLDQHVQAIQDLQTRLDAMKQKGGLAPEDFIKVEQPEDIYGRFLDGFDQAAEKMGTTFGGSFMDAVREKVPESVPALMDSIWLRVRSGMTNIFNNLRQWLSDNVTPQNFKIVALIAGLLAQIAASPVIGFLRRIASIFGTLAGASGAGGFLATAGRLVFTLGKLVTVGGIIITVLMHWDEIWARLGPVIDTTVGILREFATDVLAAIVDKLGGAEEASRKFGEVFASLRDIGADVSNFFASLPELILSADFQSIGTNIAQILMNAFNVAKTQIVPILGAIFASIGEVIVSALPPGVIEWINNLRTSIGAFFEEGRLGGELLILLQQIGDLLYQLAVTLGPVLIAVLGVLAGIVGNVLVSAFQTFLDVLPFLEGAISGLIRMLSGVIQIISGAVQAIRGFWLLLTGDTEQAQILLTSASEKMREGFERVFSGMLLFVTNALAGTIAAVVSFVSHFLTNLDFVTQKFGQAPHEWVQQLDIFKTNALQTLSDFVTNAREFILGLVDGNLVANLSSKASAAGKSFVEAIKKGISDAWGGVVSWFENQVEPILEPIERLGGAVIGIFGGMQDEVVEHSIVPEMTGDITNLFTSMQNTVKTNLQTWSRQTLMIWQQFATQMVRIWQVAVQQIIDLARVMLSNMSSVLNSIISLFNKWKNAIDDVLDKLEELPEKLDKLEDHVGPVRDLASAFGDLRDAIQDAVDKAEDLVSQLEQVIELQNEIGQNIGGGNGDQGGGGGGESEFQTGAWRIPRTMPAILHKGETVLPPGAAQAFRDLVGSLRGNNLTLGNLALGQPALAANMGEASYNIFGPGAFQGAFPNVRDGKDARSFIRELDNLTDRGALRGNVVG